MSGDSYKITDQNSIHFLTLTIVDWIDLFSRKEYSYIVIDSLNYCCKEKGLIVFSYVIMTNHIHLICKVNEPHTLSEFLRDFKKFTSKQFIKAMQEIGESRKEWMINKFAFEAKRIGRANNYKIWKDDNHAIEIGDYIDIEQKADYIHDNPVKAMIVENAVDYIFSSARDYADCRGYVEITKF
ncbi:MAG: transposase [Bacteroidetes bacterium]|nr:transposase [Bacteroidota bacterium]